MTYDEIKAIIANSHQAEWLHIESKGVWTYTHDLLIHIKEEQTDAGQDDRQFHEPWLERFADKKAYRTEFTIYYGNSPVESITMVSVDGHRTLMPLPKSLKELIITRWQYRFAKLLDRDPAGPYSLDAQLHHAGFKIEE
ncbi:hypothetical protein KSC_026560 [Ktedonobacter sp. SOSP1-52]|uniref:hypothetical protein n=1 Tax=Ktedonobacter sp. SOSP1-52 TaxID=2778366 RepID=UPI00191655F6|nr:hypothetical protein [Ktedonobacter sp. SOSP1-52]GHO63764.1 hypothetical protein KSC_026560 [Ktedonobacter sp. SOSP1-52]